jgi:hypothetical protein
MITFGFAGYYKGFELGHELGFYLGCVEGWLSLIEKFPEKFPQQKYVHFNFFIKYELVSLTHSLLDSELRMLY